jgi:hypothetical protein
MWHKFKQDQFMGINNSHSLELAPQGILRGRHDFTGDLPHVLSSIRKLAF